MEKLTFKIAGLLPGLLMHNRRLSNPLDPIAKQLAAISRKRGKTDDDYSEIARLEWYGSLYTQAGHVVIPGENIEAMLIVAARRRKLGKAAQAAIFCLENPPLIYDGPHDIDALWKCGHYVFTASAKVQGSRVLRTRPIFREWWLEFSIDVDTEMLNATDVRGILLIAGSCIGLGDWRPKFGRFIVE